MKDATLTMTLKTPDGYKSTTKGEISMQQWELINRVIEDEPLFTKQDMLKFGEMCVTNPKIIKI
jgi:hypothetical protein